MGLSREKVKGLTDWQVAQTITTMSAGSTCRLHASQTLKLLPYNSSHMVLGNPVNSLLKQAAIFSIQQSDILQTVNTSVPAAL